MIDQKAIDFFTTEVILAKVNAEVDSLLAQEFHISGYPTSVLVGEDGEEIDRIVGYLEVDDFLKTIVDYQNGIGTLDDLLARAELEPDRELYLEIAEKYKYRGGSDEARNWYQKVIDAGEPTDSLSGEGRMSLADMLRRAKEYEQALEAYGSIMKDFSGEMIAQDAEIWRAIAYRQMGDTTQAINAFQEYIEHYPESEDVEYATKQIDKLKGVEPGT
ncbi:MAG: tetratricopeptide repeat protein [candidate division Zixibacteria bacterium]|nr:tetratricopeptide repeat protein [candidate division Zixibacteria bacterium]